VVTGIDEVAMGDTAKRLQLLKEAVPAISRVAVLGSAPSEAGHTRAVAEAQQAAQAIGVTVTVFRVWATMDLDGIFVGFLCAERQRDRSGDTPDQSSRHGRTPSHKRYPDLRIAGMTYGPIRTIV
jgi:hypothetical protein